VLTIVQRGGAARQKPPEVVRGQSSRLSWAWDGLCFAVPFNDPTRDAARDVVVNAPPSTVVGLGWTRDNQGNPAALITSAANNYIQYPDNPQHTRPSTGLTMYARIRRNGTPELAGGVLCKRYDINHPYQSWGIYGSDVTTNALMAQINTTVNKFDLYNTYVLDTTTWYSVFFRWATDTAPRLDVLGERGQTLSNTTLGSTVGGTISYAAFQPMNITATENETQNGDYAYSQLMVWSRRLSDTELQALVADPYGWYSPRRETVGLSSPYPLLFGAGEMKSGTTIGGLR
jgi:hypothetical protein